MFIPWITTRHEKEWTIGERNNLDPSSENDTKRKNLTLKATHSMTAVIEWSWYDKTFKMENRLTVASGKGRDRSGK